MAKFLCFTLALCAVASASPILSGIQGLTGLNVAPVISNLTALPAKLASSALNAEQGAAATNLNLASTLPTAALSLLSGQNSEASASPILSGIQRLPGLSGLEGLAGLSSLQGRNGLNGLPGNSSLAASLAELNTFLREVVNDNNFILFARKVLNSLFEEVSQILATLELQQLSDSPDPDRIEEQK